MKPVASLCTLILVVCFCAACDQPALIGPDDKIGAMTVEQGTYGSKYPLIWDFCEYIPESPEPATLIVDCAIPSQSGLALGAGWGAKESKIASNWDAMSYEMYIDDQKLDLDQFEWEEQEELVYGRARHWTIHLVDPSPGEHTFRYLWSADEPVDDGYDVYAPGVYEYVVNFTITEKEHYPVLTSDVKVGQNPYYSEESQLEYLLYIPEAYGQDPARQWPLILFLHGYVDGLQNTGQIKREILPGFLEERTDFPFIVVSPLRTGGRGDIEYWFREEHTAPLFQLVEEVSALYAVDPDRVYLNGESAGGNGVWEIGLQYPGRFAALVPLMGYFGFPFKVPENICDLKDVPIWAFHGALDETVPLMAEQELVDALLECGGQAQITIFPEAGHDLEAERVYTSELIDWLLSHSLK